MKLKLISETNYEIIERLRIYLINQTSRAHILKMNERNIYLTRSSSRPFSFSWKLAQILILEFFFSVSQDDILYKYQDNDGKLNSTGCQRALCRRQNKYICFKVAFLILFFPLHRFAGFSVWLHRRSQRCRDMTRLRQQLVSGHAPYNDGDDVQRWLLTREGDI